MADVRSLLRSELASRRGSSQTGSSTPNRVTKKRKVDPTESLTRKKVRLATSDQLLEHAQIRPPSAQVIAEEDDDVETLPQDVMKTDIPSQFDIAQEIVEMTTQPIEVPSRASTETNAVPQAIDEDEWAAFEREVAAPSRVPQRPAAVAAAATISAAPISTEELAALQEENEIVRRNREAEAEGEREDAARFLEEEFDEMEQLEERVRRLKQKREELRMKRGKESAESVPMDEVASTPTIAPEPLPNPAETKSVDNMPEDDDEEDDEIDDDWDNWRFR